MPVSWKKTISSLLEAGRDPAERFVETARPRDIGDPPG